MSEIVITTLIGAGQAITLGLIGLVGIRLGKVKSDVGKVKADAAASRRQVENSHDTNLREENDERHEETKSWVKDLRSTFTGEIRTLRTEIGKDMGGIRQELRDDRRSTNDRFDALDERLQKIDERTR